MVDNSSWRSLCFITPLFNTWPRFLTARMISFLLILVCCYLKTIKYAWQLLLPASFVQVCIAQVVITNGHLYCDEEVFTVFVLVRSSRVTALTDRMWSVRSSRCTQWLMLSSSPQRGVIMCRREGVGWGEPASREQ